MKSWMMKSLFWCTLGCIVWVGLGIEALLKSNVGAACMYFGWCLIYTSWTAFDEIRFNKKHRETTRMLEQVVAAQRRLTEEAFDHDDWDRVFDMLTPWGRYQQRRPRKNTERIHWQKEGF